MATDQIRAKAVSVTGETPKDPLGVDGPSESHYSSPRTHRRIVEWVPSCPTHGEVRVYAHIGDAAFGADAWLDGVRRGNTFVTNGPMLELEVERKQIGDTLRLDQAREVAVSGSANSQFPLDRVELVYNGKVLTTAALTENGTRATISARVKLNRSGWLALRAAGPGHPDHPVGRQDAHTSPIYVEVAGKPAASREDAKFFLKWIDRLSLALRVRDRVPNEQLRQHVQSQLEAARQVYSEIAERN